jgi:hypothetical protein
VCRPRANARALERPAREVLGASFTRLTRLRDTAAPRPRTTTPTDAVP